MKKVEIEAKLTKHDRQIAAIQKLVHTGMRILVRNERVVAELTKNVNTLVKSLERGQNGSRNPGSPRVH